VYNNTSFLVVCFAVNSRPSFERGKDTFIPEIQEHCPRCLNTPFDLLGTKAGMRRLDRVGLETIAERGLANLSMLHETLARASTGGLFYLTTE